MKALNILLVAAVCASMVACGDKDKNNSNKGSKEFRTEQTKGEQGVRPSATVKAVQGEDGKLKGKVSVTLPVGKDGKRSQKLNGEIVNWDDVAYLSAKDSVQPSASVMFFQSERQADVMVVVNYDSEMSTTGTAYVFTLSKDNETTARYKAAFIIEETTTDGLKKDIQAQLQLTGDKYASAGQALLDFENWKKEEKSEKSEGDKSQEQTEESQPQVEEPATDEGSSAQQ